MNFTTLFSAVLVTTLAGASAQAQVFRPETVRGAVLGGAAGAVLAHNDSGRTWEGAAYGAAAGAVLGSAIGHSRDRGHRDYRGPRDGVPARPGYHRHPRTSYSVGFYAGPSWHHGYHGRDRWGHRYGYGPRWPHYHAPRPVYVARPVYPVYRPVYQPVYVTPSPYPVYPSYSDFGYSRPSHAASGAVLGGLAGAIIGHNSGGRAWEGAAYGVGAGYLLGRWADGHARREAQAQTQAAAWAASAERSASAASAPASNVTIINNYYSAPPQTAMSGANRIFGR
jgi:uncharacterized protein YcfJ